MKKSQIMSLGNLNSESGQIPETDAMGREKFWEDIGRPENNGLALKIFQEECCSDCLCKQEAEKNGGGET